MIRIVMLGRTGNNLFQYAMGRVLAAKHGAGIAMDGAWFNQAGWKSVRCIRSLPLRARVGRLPSIPARALRKLTGKHPWELAGWPVIRELDGFGPFNPAFLDAPQSCVLIGYFQSPRYFDSLDNDLRQELDMSRLPWDSSTSSVGRRIGGACSVAVHIRRTDYVGNQDFDLYGEAYFRHVMDDFRMRLRNPRFFLFSDDPNWCLRFNEPDTEIVVPGGDGDGPLRDLFLMSLARHHIIANSSYSWWGAWLGRKPGQIVVCPPRWFAVDGAAPIEDKLCPGWEIGPSLAR